MTDTLPDRTTVLVVGGGPAGSTVATLLAKRGIDVVLLERARFPRYHVGESLLPSVLPILDLLGVRNKIDEAGFTKKYGGFMSWANEEWSIDFDVLGGDQGYSYQVRRADFDMILLDHAEETGAQVFQETSVARLRFEGDRPVAALWESGGRSGEIAFDFLVDASGRRGLMATRYLRNRENHPIFQNVAMWGYWEGCTFRSDTPRGAIYNASVPEGWFWAIPLHDGTTSVGLVIHRSHFKKIVAGEGLEAFYRRTLGDCQLMADMTGEATLVSELRTETDYSYAAQRFCGPGFLLAGDSACFLDPLLSSGIHLAMFSALLASAAITSVVAGDFEESVALEYYESCYRRAYLRLLVFVSSFYNQNEAKEGHFWNAHQLTDLDLDEVSLKYAFTSLIAGLEDIKMLSGDVSDAVFAGMEERIESKNAEAKRLSDERRTGAPRATVEAGGGARDFFGERVEGLFALDPSEAIEGVYVAIEGGVHLRRVAAEQALEVACE